MMLLGLFVVLLLADWLDYNWSVCYLCLTFVSTLFFFLFFFFFRREFIKFSDLSNLSIDFGALLKTIKNTVCATIFCHARGMLSGHSPWNSSHKCQVYLTICLSCFPHRLFFPFNVKKDGCNSTFLHTSDKNLAVIYLTLLYRKVANPPVLYDMAC